MNFRQLAVLLGATAGVLGEVRRALVGMERSKHVSVAGALPVALLVGTGVVIGAIASRPEVRRRVGEWLIGKEAPPPQTAAAPEAPARGATRAQPYANGA